MPGVAGLLAGGGGTEAAAPADGLIGGRPARGTGLAPGVVGVTLDVLAVRVGGDFHAPQMEYQDLLNVSCQKLMVIVHYIIELRFDKIQMLRAAKG